MTQLDTDNLREQCQLHPTDPLGRLLWHAATELDELRASVKAMGTAFANSGCDISPCTECRKPVVCLPEGLAMCRTCAEAVE
jgi:hypothetical protein